MSSSMINDHTRRIIQRENLTYLVYEDRDGGVFVTGRLFKMFD